MFFQLNVAELQVSDKADYKKRLEVLEEQQELIQDEKEQEQKEAEARSAAKAKEQEEKEAAVAEEEAAKAKAAEPEQLAEVISDQVSCVRALPIGTTEADIVSRSPDPRSRANYKKTCKISKTPRRFVLPRNSSMSLEMRLRFFPPNHPSCRSVPIYAA